MMKLNYRRALVTGGAGFIGSHLVDALIQCGCKVKVLDDLSTGDFSNLSNVKEKIDFFQGDVRDVELLTSLADGCEVIFHQAAMVSVPQTVAAPLDSAYINELGTLGVLEAARNRRVKRVVFASSCAVYGNEPELPKHETTPLSPESPYAVQKRVGEQYAHLYSKLYKVETVCLRYFNVYGPRQDPNSPYSGVISVFLNKATNDSSPVIYGNGKQSRDFIFVKDVVKANLIASNSDDFSGECFNVGTGKSVTINQLWETIRIISKCNAKPKYAKARPGDVLASMAGTDHVKSTLGFRPDFPLKKGLEVTLRWFKEIKEQSGCKGRA
jgi:UDP-glucose 4-epimerase